MGPDPSESLTSILASLPARLLGNRFFVITKEATIASIQQKVEMAGLMNLHTQWLYLVTDSTERSQIVSEQIKQVFSGDRDEVRQHAIAFAMTHLVKMLSEN